MSPLVASLHAEGLAVLGRCPVEAADGLPGWVESLALVGPSGPEFWAVFSASEEASDGAPDPLDRWSRRVLDGVAKGVDGLALFPFGGPPWHPFIAWALRTGVVWTSPVGLLVHREHGLFVSFRGAIALRDPAPPPSGVSPCETCAGQPCRTACPPAALSIAGYDVPACHAHLDTSDGASCLSGCLVRRACPVGQDLRPRAQSAFHMQAFHRSD